jgi:hypothetical protein
MNGTNGGVISSNMKQMVRTIVGWRRRHWVLTIFGAIIIILVYFGLASTQSQPRFVDPRLPQHQVQHQEEVLVCELTSGDDDMLSVSPRFNIVFDPESRRVISCSKLSGGTVSTNHVGEDIIDFNEVIHSSDGHYYMWSFKINRYNGDLEVKLREGKTITSDSLYEGPYKFAEGKCTLAKKKF